jgi:hypothetical protein
VCVYVYVYVCVCVCVCSAYWLACCCALASGTAATACSPACRATYCHPLTHSLTHPLTHSLTQTETGTGRASLQETPLQRQHYKRSYRKHCSLSRALACWRHSLPHCTASPRPGLRSRTACWPRRRARCTSASPRRSRKGKPGSLARALALHSHSHSHSHSTHTRTRTRACNYLSRATCMLYCTVLYCIVLYCTVLYCIVLYCIVLYCIVLYCAIVTKLYFEGYATIKVLCVCSCSDKNEVFNGIYKAGEVLQYVCLYLRVLIVCLYLSTSYVMLIDSFFLLAQPSHRLTFSPVRCV